MAINLILPEPAETGKTNNPLRGVFQMVDYFSILKNGRGAEIRPLNMTANDYQAHFEEHEPACYSVSLTINVLSPEACVWAREHTQDAVNALAAAICATGLPAEIQSRCTLEVGIPSLWRNFTDAQKQWLIDGAYVQIAIWNHERVELLFPERALAVAETYMDLWISDSGSIEPVMHDPTGFQIPFVEMQEDDSGIVVGGDDSKAVDVTDDGGVDEIARSYRLFIGDLFAESVGLHCRWMIDLRNQLLVRIHAQLRGRDPDAAWKDFQNAGHVYFLDSMI